MHMSPLFPSINLNKLLYEIVVGVYFKEGHIEQPCVQNHYVTTHAPHLHHVQLAQAQGKRSRCGKVRYTVVKVDGDSHSQKA